MTIKELAALLTKEAAELVKPEYVSYQDFNRDRNDIIEELCNKFLLTDNFNAALAEMHINAEIKMDDTRETYVKLKLTLANTHPLHIESLQRKTRALIPVFHIRKKKIYGNFYDCNFEAINGDDVEDLLHVCVKQIASMETAIAHKYEDIAELDAIMHHFGISLYDLNRMTDLQKQIGIKTCCYDIGSLDFENYRKDELPSDMCFADNELRKDIATRIGCESHPLNEKHFIWSSPLHRMTPPHWTLYVWPNMAIKKFASKGFVASMHDEFNIEVRDPEDVLRKDGQTDLFFWVKDSCPNRYFDNSYRVHRIAQYATLVTTGNAKVYPEEIREKYKNR